MIRLSSSCFDRRRLWWLASALPVLATLFFVVFGKAWLNSGAHRGVYGESMRMTAQMVFPKEDLYRALATIDVDLASIGEYRFFLRHRYAGLYSIGLLTEARPRVSDHDPSDLDFDFSIECRSEGGSFADHVQGEGLLFLGQEVHGFLVADYQVPQDLPLDATVACLVHVLAPATRFEEVYGRQRLEVGKASEE